MLPTDYVLRACVGKNMTCTLTCKCAVCKKEIEDLKSIDSMFQKVFKSLNIKIKPTIE